MTIILLEYYIIIICVIHLYKNCIIIVQMMCNALLYQDVKLKNL